MKTLLALLALLALALPSRAQEFKLAGQRSEIKETRFVVARDSAQFLALWKQHAPSARAPKVDFTREMVVAVFLGARPRSGTTVELTLLPDPLDARKLVVFYKEVTPEAKGFAAQVVSYPFQMVAVPKGYADVAFERDLKARALVKQLEDDYYQGPTCP